MTIYVCSWCGAAKGSEHKFGCVFTGKTLGPVTGKSVYVCSSCGVRDGDPHISTCPFSSVDSYQIGGDHYKELAVQPWEAMESWMSDAEFEGFLRGNVIKYLARAGKKGDELQDLKKALHYLEKLVSVKERRG